jgi:hypothetical protein|tara:strand:- start:546 stop:827 length:282 start_codon:yes stop_codon:yes gene_type:complete
MSFTSNVTFDFTSDDAITKPFNEGHYAVSASGDFGGGTMDLTDADGVPVYSFTASEATGLIFMTNELTMTLTGSTAPTLQVRVADLTQRTLTT